MQTHQGEIDSPISFGPLSETDSLKQRITKLEAENHIIKAENIELKARIAKLEDNQTQNEIVKNLLSVSRKA